MLVASCCVYGDEASGSGATELVIYAQYCLLDFFDVIMAI
jgi:hypothetical protein